MSNGTPHRTIQIRALPSAFATKATPSIPPPSDTYEPLVKVILRRRLTHYVSLRSAVCCWVVASIWSGWNKWGTSVSGFGSFLVNPLMPTTILYACIFWLLACLPTVVLRKKFLTATSVIATSPSKTLSLSMSKPTTIHSALTYCASALCIAAIHVVSSQDARLSLFVKSRKHPYYLNGRLLFLLCFQVFIALGFTMRSVMLDRFIFHAKTSSAGKPFVFPDLARVVAVAALLTTVTLPVSMLSYMAARILVLPILFKFPFIPMFFKPFMAHFLRAPWHMLMPFRYAALLSRAWFLGTTTLILWELSNALFDHYIPQPVTVGPFTADPTLTTISGATSSDLIMKHFAYAELKELSIDESPTGSARRTALFGDQKYIPSLWSTLVKDGLTTLGRDYQYFLRRGAPAPSPPVATPAPAPPQPAFPATPKKLISRPIYQSSKQSPIRNVIDSLAADGSIAQAIDEAHVPDVFRSVTNAVVEPANAAAKEEVEKVRVAGKGLIGHVWSLLHAGATDVATKYAPNWAQNLLEAWTNWWTKERLGKVAEGYLPNRELDALVIEVLTNLTCASLTEDRYGIVQRDIPKILEALLSFLSEIESYQKEVNAMYTPPATDKRLSLKELEESEFVRGQVESAGEALGTVGGALKDGIASIVRTFGDKLLAFKFPPRTASKLQTFMDYC